MTIDERLTNVSVIGAAGKMGSGIATLMAQEMVKLKLMPENRDKIYRLNLIDISEKALDGLQKYLQGQIIKSAEKDIVQLRNIYENRTDLIENGDIIQSFVDDTLSILRFGTDQSMAKDSKIVFEAIVENANIKVKVLKYINKMCGKDTLYFTNTSSVPISFLDEKIGLDGRIIGYHFYNPPIVQRLVEVITARSTTEELKTIGNEIGKRMSKKLVPSNDIAGFIGNGHFMRDGLHAIKEAKRLKTKFSLPGAIYIMNRVSQDFMIRPMGIFQLIDYVGLDVFQCILKVMKTHLGDKRLKSPLIDAMVSKNVLGGQKADGSQKDGFFKYEKNRPCAVYNMEKGDWTPFDANWDSIIGELPAGFIPWRKLLQEPDKNAKLTLYFENLKSASTHGAKLARVYLARTKEIAEELVKQGVANSQEDVNAVLINGFYWLYGPINQYV